MTSVLYAIVSGDKGGTAKHGKNKVVAPLIVGDGYTSDEYRYIQENAAVFAVSDGEKTVSIYRMTRGAFNRAPGIVKLSLVIAMIFFVFVVIPTIVCMVVNLCRDWDSYLMTFICMGGLLLLFAAATLYVAMRM